MTQKTSPHCAIYYLIERVGDNQVCTNDTM